MTPFQQALALKQQARDFLDEFGSRAAVYIAAGLNWDQAIAEHCNWLAAENEKLRKQLAQLDQAERVPLSSGGADLDLSPAKRQGLVNKLKVQE